MSETSGMTADLGSVAREDHPKTSYDLSLGIVLQMKICLNDVRQYPLKYKSLYPCDFDTAVAPKLSAMKSGTRLPLHGTGTSTTVSFDRLCYPLFDERFRVPSTSAIHLLCQREGILGNSLYLRLCMQALHVWIPTKDSLNKGMGCTCPADIQLVLGQETCRFLSTFQMKCGLLVDGHMLKALQVDESQKPEPHSCTPFPCQSADAHCCIPSVNTCLGYGACSK